MERRRKPDGQLYHCLVWVQAWLRHTDTDYTAQITILVYWVSQKQATNMARGRMVNRTVATDKALNSLSLEAHLLYLMTVPHLDRDGLILGDAPLLFAIAVPRRPEFAEKIDKLVQEWIDKGLVMSYEGHDGRILYFSGFQKNNPELRYDREGPSQLPPPPGMMRTKDGLTPEQHLPDSGVTPEQVRSESGVGPEQVPVKLSEVEDKGKLRERTAAPAAAGLPPGPARRGKPDKRTDDAKRETNETFVLAQELAKVCAMDFTANQGRLLKEAATLHKCDPPGTPAMLVMHYGHAHGAIVQPAWWYSCDWRGRKGEFPTPGTIRETWGQWNKVPPVVPHNGNGRNGHAPDDGLTPAFRAGLAVIAELGGFDGDG